MAFAAKLLLFGMNVTCASQYTKETVLQEAGGAEGALSSLVPLQYLHNRILSPLDSVHSGCFSIDILRLGIGSPVTQCLDRRVMSESSSIHEGCHSKIVLRLDIGSPGKKNFWHTCLFFLFFV